MGCKHSQINSDKSQNKKVCGDGGEKAMIISPSGDDDKQVCQIDKVSNVELTARHKELIQDSWKLMVDNISSVGVITFMRLFETHPDVQEVFMPFKGLTQEELRHSKQLRAHGLRVMSSVQKVVARIDEPDKTLQILKELGRNHVRYGAKVQYVDLIGPQFVYAVKPSMEDDWTDEIEEAWITLFTYIADIMKTAMLDELGGSRGGDAFNQLPTSSQLENTTSKQN